MNKALSRNGMHFNPDKEPYPFAEGFKPVGITDSKIKKNLLDELTRATVDAHYKSKGEVRANAHCKEFKR